jgi:hemolysin III
MTAAASCGEADGAMISSFARRLGTGAIIPRVGRRWLPGMTLLMQRRDEGRPRMRGVSHQWAFVASLVAGAVLVLGAPSGRAAGVGGLYAAALAGMFGASALYHRVAWRPSVRAWMRRLDHSMIFVLIAATYTPVLVLGLDGLMPAIVLAIVWSGAAVGVALKLVWVAAPERLVASVYVMLGWVGLALLPQVVASAGALPALLFVAGGLLYTAGAVVYVRRRPDPSPAVFGFHEVFHVLVIAAAIAHYVAIAGFVVPNG